LNACLCNEVKESELIRQKHEYKFSIYKNIKDEYDSFKALNHELDTQNEKLKYEYELKK